MATLIMTIDSDDDSKSIKNEDGDIIIAPKTGK
jgi:hypothetical protein